ncbi:MAG: response regulator [Desulfobacterales bacterium]|nr:response regulator [Desulfobacterales bacterium]
MPPERTDENQASKILVVDDRPENLFAMETILSGFDARIFKARSGREALHQLVRHHFALALLDVQMPEMDGFELAELMRNNKKTRTIPIIFVTAISKERRHIFRGYDAGAVDYLLKPVEPEILKQKVRVFLTLDRQKRLLEQTAGELSDMNRELQKARRELERRVEERTAGLNAANKRLTREIEERRRAEEEMRRLRNYLKNVVDSMPSLLIGVDPAGRVTQWNREAEKETGIKASEARGSPFVDLFPDLAGEMEGARRAARLQKPRKSVKVVREIDRVPRYADVAVYPLFTDGVEEGAVIRVDDVTDRVRMEEMMIQTEKMMSVGGLAAGMAHEINNPLAVIMQNLQVMRNRLNRDLPKNRRAADECGLDMGALESYMNRRELFTMIEAARGAGSRASKIVGNMLNFSRKTPSRLAPRNLGELLDKTVDLARNDHAPEGGCDFRKIEIVREYDPEPVEAPCDDVKIQQSFLNLLKNGARAMYEKRPAFKEKGEDNRPRFTLRVMRDGPMARVEIEDNGPGMDEAVRKRIFEPFFTTSEIGVGAGLGLAVAYFIITDDHRGALEVESTPGKGARFIIRLPMDDGESNAETGSWNFQFQQRK